MLREAAVQQHGERLSEVGSRIVCETIIGFIKLDFNSYLNAPPNENAIKQNGIGVKPGAGGRINEIGDILKFAGVF